MRVDFKDPDRIPFWEEMKLITDSLESLPFRRDEA